MRDEAVSREVLGAAIEVHRALGPGLLERTYRRCLVHELGLRGLSALPEVPLDLTYKGLEIEGAYRMDVLVEGSVVVEIKAVDDVHEVHEAQLLTYLRLSGRRTGFILNFKKKRMRDGIHRRVL
jgi:GxxExxY protein